MIFTVMARAGTSMISASHHSKTFGNFASLKYKLELTATIADTIISETFTLQGKQDERQQRKP